MSIADAGLSARAAKITEVVLPVDGGWLANGLPARDG